MDELFECNLCIVFKDKHEAYNCVGCSGFLCLDCFKNWYKCYKCLIKELAFSQDLIDCSDSINTLNLN